MPNRLGMPRPEHPPAPLPTGLVYSSAILCGVLAALALQLFLGRVGFDLAAVWQNLFTPSSRQLSAAGPWSAIASVAFIASGAAAAVLSRSPLPWRRFRTLRWAAAAGVVFLLADLGHSGAGPAGVAAGANVVARLGALAVAVLMGMLGAYLTIRR